MGIQKNLIQITFTLALIALGGTAAYYYSFENFEKCLSKQEQQFNCDQYDGFKLKLECRRYLQKIKQMIKIDEIYQKLQDSQLTQIQKLKRTTDFERKIRNLPYGMEEKFEEIHNQAMENYQFYMDIFNPTYQFCLKDK
ncbi:transmembrane protein, putative (macronuclear) [Tetrahymena thermophila SB210]|uniref:Transmembrane protein, putative n=1 Tax=Tetrahymena thermophila (strain SB210) TaxID=312017 RepID=I7M8X8_TETTS|nr:transmembrane protein, putative [Tetrahymena thermophila SB210]EAS00253.1 transmembrane protein, putative [Tetrahymena thermophila SB210]|eukprot:XP_001020498.1 transmembrane protein, putative [Tetrahymena thermophila SB210]